MAIICEQHIYTIGMRKQRDKVGREKRGHTDEDKGRIRIREMRATTVLCARDSIK